MDIILQDFRLVYPSNDTALLRTKVKSSLLQSTNYRNMFDVPSWLAFRELLEQPHSFSPYLCLFRLAFRVLVASLLL